MFNENVILFDTEREKFLPLSYTRPISFFRVGIRTIKEKWELYYKNVSVRTVDYLSSKYSCVLQEENLWINSSIIPNENLILEINSLRKGEVLKSKGIVIAINNCFID